MTSDKRKDLLKCGFNAGLDFASESKLVGMYTGVTIKYLNYF